MTKVCYLSSWKEFSSQLKETLAEARLDPKSAIIRLCARKNLQRIIESGTDRDQSSSVWLHPGDANHGSEQIDPERIFYAWILDTTQNPFKRLDCNIANNIQPFYINNFPEIFDAKKDISPGQIAVFYDSSKVKRRSTFEYAFLEDPKTALIRVFALQKDTRDEPQMSYYFN